jgi:hypothetical protein
LNLLSSRRAVLAFANSNPNTAELLEITKAYYTTVILDINQAHDFIANSVRNNQTAAGTGALDWEAWITALRDSPHVTSLVDLLVFSCRACNDIQLMLSPRVVRRDDGWYEMWSNATSRIIIHGDLILQLVGAVKKWIIESFSYIFLQSDTSLCYDVLIIIILYKHLFPHLSLPSPVPVGGVIRPLSPGE